MSSRDRFRGMIFNVGDIVTGVVGRGEETPWGERMPYGITTAGTTMEVVSVGNTTLSEDEEAYMAVKVMCFTDGRSDEGAVGVTHQVNQRFFVRLKTEVETKKALAEIQKEEREARSVCMDNVAEAYMKDTGSDDPAVKAAVIAGMMNAEAVNRLGTGYEVGSSAAIVSKAQDAVNIMADVCRGNNCSQCLYNMKSAKRVCRGESFDCLRAFTLYLTKGNLNRLRKEVNISAREW